MPAVSPAVQTHSLSLATSANTWGEAGPDAIRRQQKCIGVPETKKVRIVPTIKLLTEGIPNFSVNREVPLLVGTNLRI